MMPKISFACRRSSKAGSSSRHTKGSQTLWHDQSRSNSNTRQETVQFRTLHAFVGRAIRRKEIVKCAEVGRSVERYGFQHDIWLLMAPSCRVPYASRVGRTGRRPGGALSSVPHDRDCFALGSQ